MEKIKKIIKKLWDFTFKTEKGLYLVFGGLTTLVSIVTFWICFTILGENSQEISTVIKNAAGILFAYFTNRKYVFKSENNTAAAKTLEALQFFATRIATLFIDMLLLSILKDRLGISEYIGTVITTVVVIVLNYIASKLYIFKRKD
ncbi:MAG TPA: GtrA family protein [Bacillota bacterium]|nr:GtrA family protein [Bacillota bacterium]HOK68143.1 GtrA family protein [Bacillota bacterium]HPP84445.1 GtrA family protein [Bacillota bacterium]